MTLVTRKIIGVIHKPNGSAWANAPVRFRLRRNVGLGNIVVPSEDLTVMTNVNGAFECILYTLSGSSLPYRCILPNTQEFKFLHVPGDGSDIYLSELLVANTPVVDGQPLFDFVAQKIDEHEAAADPHTSYLTQAEGDSRYAQNNDSRFSDSRTPTGAAGGVLSGNYPNPGFAVPMATQSQLDTLVGATTTALASKADLIGGKIPSAQLPSYVDDVLEYADIASLPVIGETEKIYVTLDENKTYRWSGSAYIEVSSGGGAQVPAYLNAPFEVEEYADFDSFPAIGNEGVYYYAQDDGGFYKWSDVDAEYYDAPFEFVKGGGSLTPEYFPKTDADGKLVDSHSYETYDVDNDVFDTVVEGRLRCSDVLFDGGGQSLMEIAENSLSYEEIRTVLVRYNTDIPDLVTVELLELALGSSDTLSFRGFLMVEAGADLFDFHFTYDTDALARFQVFYEAIKIEDGTRHYRYSTDETEIMDIISSSSASIWVIRFEGLIETGSDDTNGSSLRLFGQKRTSTAEPTTVLAGSRMSFTKV